MKEHETPSVVRERIEDWVKLSMEFATRKEEQQDADKAMVVSPHTQLNTQSSTEEPSAAVLKEVKKGYDMIFVGLKQALLSNGEKPDTFHASIAKIVSDSKGVLAIVVTKDEMAPELRMRTMDILVPTSGAEYSRRAGEVAIAIAKACRCRVTALHVYPPQNEGLFMRRIREHLEPARALVRSLQELGKREGVPVKTIVKVRRAPEPVILRQIKKGKHNLVVLGVNTRPGEKLFFGPKAKVLLERVPCSLLLVIS